VGDLDEATRHVGYAARVKPRFRHQGDNREVALEMSVEAARAILDAFEVWLPLDTMEAGRAVMVALESLEVRP
jgi:hypothetical protein